jgi:ribosomal protein S18 acetylase RimI-like enzyme
MAYSIENTTEKDLDFIYQLFEEAILYQKAKGVVGWNVYDKNAIQNDIANQLQLKIIENDNILAIFSYCLSDPLIWREKEKGDAIYLHRIVVNPKFKGQNQFLKVLNWAKEYAQTHQLKFIRLDTWGNNAQIIEYYQSFGFRFVENYTTPDMQDLPLQHRNLYVALLEYYLIC